MDNVPEIDWRVAISIEDFISFRVLRSWQMRIGRGRPPDRTQLKMVHVHLPHFMDALCGSDMI